MPDKNITNVEIHLYYANWCGYCVRFKPTWEIVKTNMPNDKELKKINLSFHECEDSNINNDLKAKDVENSGIKIKSYPTIIVKIDKEYIQYPNDKREYDLIKKFILCKVNSTNCSAFNTNESSNSTNSNSNSNSNLNSNDNQEGGYNPDYRKKYKKYKHLYKEILIKYSELKNKK